MSNLVTLGIGLPAVSELVTLGLGRSIPVLLGQPSPQRTFTPEQDELVQAFFDGDAFKPIAFDDCIQGVDGIFEATRQGAISFGAQEAMKASSDPEICVPEKRAPATPRKQGAVRVKK